MFAWCFKLLTLVAFVGHVMLGCCAHHAHASDATSIAFVENDTLVASHCHANCGHRQSCLNDSQSDESQEHSEDHGDCAEVECSYTELNDNVKAVEMTSWTSFEAVVVSLLLAVPSGDSTSFHAGVTKPPVTCSPLDTCAQFHSWQL